MSMNQDKVPLVDENLGNLILTQVFHAFVQDMHFDPVFCRESIPQSKEQGGK
jgi:hypothetical protein